MKRWATCWRAVVAVALVCLAALPFANYHWWLFDVKDYNPETGAAPEFISAPVSITTEWITYHTVWIFPNWPDVLLAALAAIGLFVLIGGNRAASPRETRCAACHSVLRGLSDARCPHCGSPF